MPLGAYGGRRDIMECVAPLGPVYQAGTLSGNPLAMAARLAAMERLRSELYRQLERRSGPLERGLHDAAADGGADMQVAPVGSMMGASFHAEPVRNYPDAHAVDRCAYARLFCAP